MTTVSSDSSPGGAQVARCIKCGRGALFLEGVRPPRPRKDCRLSEQVFDVREALQLVRQQRWMVTACVLVGALIPIGVILSRPPSYSAVSLVLVPNSTNASSSSNSAAAGNITDTDIAVSSTILGRAGAETTPPISYQTAKQRVTAVPVATNLVQITASGTSPRQAEQLANNVATRLVAFVTSTGDSEGSSALSELQAEASQLTSQVTNFDKEIKADQANLAAHGASSAAGLEETQLLTSLTGAESNAELQLQSVNSQISAAKLELAAANGGTEIIQYASSASPSPLIRKFAPVLAGAVIGFLIGSAIAVLGRKRRSMTLRDDFARAVGGPVILSLPVGRWTKSTSNWLTMLRTPDPSADELWRVSKALDQLELPADGQPTITVITLAKDTAGIALMTRVAIASASMDIPTLLVLTSEDQSTTGLSNACDVLAARNEAGPANLQLVKDSTSATNDGAALTIISMVLDPDAPKLPAYVARGVVVLCVSAGFIDQEKLTRVLLAIGREALSVKGVFLANPLSNDQTTGLSTNSSDRASHLLHRRRLDSLPEPNMKDVESI